MYTVSIMYIQRFAMGFFVVSALLFTSAVANAWSEPTGNPTTGDVDAPINVGPVNQVKDGGIGVNSLAVFGNSIFGGSAGSNAYLNFGGTSGVNGYGIRDNSGIIEFKNDGGDWASLQQTLYDLCGGDCSGGGGGGMPVAFLVNKGGTNQSVSAGAWTKLTWSTEAFDTNDNFANNRFTPTVAGKYLFTLTAYCEGSGDNDDCWVAIYRNGVVVSESGTGVHDIGGSSGPNVSIVLDMNGTTDYVEAYAWNRTGSSIHGETYTTNFSGALLSPQAGGGGSSYWTASGNDILNTNSGAVRTAGEFVSGQHVSMGYMSSGGSSPVCYQSGVYWGSALGLTSCSSDARLKTNIVPLPDHTLDKIMHVRPVTFTWKKDALSIEHAGFIAQDTLPYAPET